MFEVNETVYEALNARGKPVALMYSNDEQLVTTLSGWVARGLRIEEIPMPEWANKLLLMTGCLAAYVDAIQQAMEHAMECPHCDESGSYEGSCATGRALMEQERALTTSAVEAAQHPHMVSCAEMFLACLDAQGKK